MFFELHEEGKIGYKKLTKADLGLGDSHQTHIGLFGDIFTFLSDTEVEEESLFIYNNNIDFIDCYFDRIETPEGMYRSPKIRTGNKNSISVVTFIRDKAKEYPNKDWHLIWFGLKNEKMVFYFFNNDSEDYIKVSKIIDLSNNGRVEKTDAKFQELLNYLENKIDAHGQNILEDLEIVSQIEKPTQRYREFDLKRANELFKETGDIGEQLIANYLDYLKSKKQIFNYNWYNKSSETGLPYDFDVQENNQNIIYIDAKSTSYKFEQPMIFSNQEIECMNDKINYSIYRVFGIKDGKPKLKICKNTKSLASFIYSNINEFRNNLAIQDVILKSAKLAVSPIHNFFKFGNEIELNQK